MSVQTVFISDMDTAKLNAQLLFITDSLHYIASK